MRRLVTDEQYGQFTRCVDELKRRVDERAVPMEPTLWVLKLATEGRFTELGWHAPAENGEDDIAAEVNRLVECMFRAGYHKATNGGKGMKG
ncbi:MAG: hypothetical protein ABIA47_02885, partial [bacterium]